MNKRIQYDRQTRDFAAYLDDEFIGYFASYHAAEVELDRLAYEALTRDGDIDFTNDEPTINAQLAAEGLRSAGGDESGYYAIVLEHGQPRKVWACPITQQRPAPVKRFFSYAEASGR